MDKSTAERIVNETFKARFDKQRFRDFVNELCNGFNEAKAISAMAVPDAFAPHVKSCQRLGTFESPEGELADILVVHLTESFKLDRTRTALRDFVAHKLKRGEGEDNSYKEASLVAFVAPDTRSWRFSYVRMEFATRRDPRTGKIKPEERLTPARRFSYLVGVDEQCHTAQSRFLSLLQDTTAKPALAKFEEAFSVESVTKEFFQEYTRLFEDTQHALTSLIRHDPVVRNDLAAKGINAGELSKKLLGQIVFLYFLQKKGWLGVPKGGQWGDGPHNFLRQLCNGKFHAYENFFNDVLEPLFYDTLATDRGDESWCETFNCRIPFLNGGLFEPLGQYDWRGTDIRVPNSLFSNSATSKSGDKGTGILDVFDRYNFTVNEAEPLEKDVAIDPEMLGKVFENLLEAEERKSKGSFYTPREIVHYMCQEGLINYLDTTLNHRGEMVSRADVEAFIHSGGQASFYEAARLEGTGYQRKLPESIEAHSRSLDSALAAITVCDPAIGSGAFPVGMMQEIVRARSALTPYFSEASERTAYEFKRHAIQYCLYGVDIDPAAVEIAKLRLWLSLVVDEDDVKQIKPLPNLDYKIVTGNSLLGVAKTLFNEDLFTHLEELKPRYFNASDRKTKARFKQQIDELIHELTNGNEVFDFEIYFSEIFHHGRGFDVVIANPPYIGESGHKDLFRRTKDGPLGDFYLGKMDYFYFFFHLALNIAKPNGEIAFITTNYYLTAAGARKLRADFKDRAFARRLINLNELRIFESALGQHNILTFLRKGSGSEHTKTCITDRTGHADGQALSRILQWNDELSHYYDIERAALYDGGENYIRLSRERTSSNTGKLTIDAVLDKLAAQGDALGTIANINQGVVSGCDYVSPRNMDRLSARTDAIHGDGIFVLDLANPRDKGVVDGFSSKEKLLLRKFYKNSDISRFQCSTATSKRLLYVGRDQNDLRGYPKVLEHLTRFKAILSERREVENGVIKFYQLQWPRSESIFIGPKIVVPYRSQENAFAFNDEEWFCRSDCYLITRRDSSVSLSYLLGLLNSKLYFHWLFHRGKRKGQTLEMFQIPLSEIPIKRVGSTEQRPIGRISDLIVAAKSANRQANATELERELNEAVFDLYGLTADERSLVEGGAH